MRHWYGIESVGDSAALVVIWPVPESRRALNIRVVGAITVVMTVARVIAVTGIVAAAVVVAVIMTAV